MALCPTRGETALGVQAQELAKEVNTHLANLGPHVQDWLQVGGLPPRERPLPVLQLREARPRLLSRMAQQLQLLENGAYLGVPREHWVAGRNLSNDAASRPQVDLGAILLCSKHDLRGPVPEGNHIVGVGLEGQRKYPGEAKVADLQTVPANEDVLGLEVTMEDEVRVACMDPVEELLRIPRHLLHGHGLASLAVSLQDLVQVSLYVLEDKLIA
mmetsp:Transcript_99464/g.281723  ORF Transcript_99464/g.281723 Transcript_99464/m.281723 type:complete len:214 (-) Transcript_99464:385-1026(-)